MTMTGSAQIWAPVVAQLSEAALLLDADDCLITASGVIQTALDPDSLLPGRPVRQILGLPEQATLSGTITFSFGDCECELALQPVPLYDTQGNFDGTLLILKGWLVEQAVYAREHNLREVSLIISSALDIDQILEQVVCLSIDLLKADAGSMPIYDRQRDRLLPSYVFGITAPILKQPVHRGTGIIWEMIDTGQPFLNNRYAAEPRAIPELLAQGVWSVIAVPIIASNQIMGTLNLYRTTNKTPFNERDLELLEIISRQAGVALQNARRYHAVVRESERRALLYKASLSFGAAADLEQLYVAIHEAITELVACDICTIVHFDRATRELEYVYLVQQEERVAVFRQCLDQSLLSYIVQTGMALRITSSAAMTEQVPLTEPRTVIEHPSGSLLAVALQVGETTIGALSIRSLEPNMYDASDLTTIETLAATAAIAMQKAYLFNQVEALATIDELTGIANRRYFFEEARYELERAMRYKRPVSLLMLDADYFKQINDTYGHSIGDEVLQHIAARCKTTLREVDVFGRYGGEEFLVLMPETDLAHAGIAGDRLRQVIASQPILTAAGPVATSISVGVASFDVGITGTIELLLDQADKALYEAKNAGRNQTYYYRDA
ncbi:diguanylate cyclase [Candidatus Chloroploca sp. M-50]|uniref:Diguanylate cyclase n=1 Tax=Candidatus Chloroploca mongolica TaxID=2528176 RepID=A0ABS4D989_9CHLR|nr:diguanylate cyclase [Candidatus Chloroploca mongolica]MBP1465997.1 diguanylate cyclase [Candidatus Chloroploca mongolica]